jgi:polyphosphate kinase
VRRELDLYLADNTSASLLQPDGSYLRAQPASGQSPRNVQQQLLEKLCGSGATAAVS